MAAPAVLYTPRILELATSLSAWPWNDALPWQGQARSRSCGSTLRLGLATDGAGRIDRVGLLAQACAIGQASAALFAQAAVGQSVVAVSRAEAALRAWLAGTGPMPDWPGMGELDAARGYPGRHGAILLAWQAALEALPTG